MRLGYLVAMVARETGWTLDYIGRLPIKVFLPLANQIYSQKQADIYRVEYRIGQVICALVNTRQHMHKPEDFIGERPKILEVTKLMTTKKGEPEKFPVVLADGNTYNFPMLDTNMMGAVEEEFDKGWTELFSNPRRKFIIAVVYQMLKEDYPDLTVHKVGKLLNAKVVGGVTRIITKMV